MSISQYYMHEGQHNDYLQSDIAGRFIGGYGELKGEYHCHTDGHWDNQLDNLFSSMSQSSLK